jgi:hypothetical protein
MGEMFGRDEYVYGLHCGESHRCMLISKFVKLHILDV